MNARTTRSIVVFTVAACAGLSTLGWSPLAAQTAAELQGADPPAHALWVDSLDLSKASIRRPRAPRGRGAGRPPRHRRLRQRRLFLATGGVTYAHGLPLNVNADVAIDLKGGATRFVSMVGIDDSVKTTPGTGSVTFDVWVDGKHAGDSGLIKAADAPKLMSVDLAGAHRLVLSVSDGGDGPQGDTVIWAGAPPSS